MAIKVQKVSVTHRPKESTKQLKGRVSTKRTANRRNTNVKSKRTASRI